MNSGTAVRNSDEPLTVDSFIRRDKYCRDKYYRIAKRTQFRVGITLRHATELRVLAVGVDAVGMVRAVSICITCERASMSTSPDSL